MTNAAVVRKELIGFGGWRLVDYCIAIACTCAQLSRRPAGGVHSLCCNMHLRVFSAGDWLAHFAGGQLRIGGRCQGHGAVLRTVLREKRERCEQAWRRATCEYTMLCEAAALSIAVVLLIVVLLIVAQLCARCFVVLLVFSCVVCVFVRCFVSVGDFALID